jgi:stringent starvation protein B
MEKQLPEKKDRLLHALEQGMTMIHVDARRPGVLVPEHLKNEAHLLLNLSYRFAPPDLAVGEWGVRSTLTFGGQRFTVAVPWSALYAISSHATKEFWMYPDDMPKELLESMPQPQVDVGPPAMVPSRAFLREVVSDEAPVKPRKVVNEEVASPPSRGHLRLVK